MLWGVCISTSYPELENHLGGEYFKIKSKILAVGISGGEHGCCWLSPRKLPASNLPLISTLPWAGTPVMLTQSLRRLSIYPATLVLPRGKENGEEKSFFLIYAHTQNEMKGDGS